MTQPNLQDMPLNEFQEAAQRAVDWISDYFQHIDDYSVLPEVSPGDTRSALPHSAPDSGETFEDILSDFEKIIVPGMTHWNHPAFMAYFSITGSGPGIIGELLSAALNNNAMLWKSGPSATELEEVTLNWLRQMIGLPEEFWGIVYDTASVSTMHAIAAAREQLNLDIRQRGMAGRPDRPMLRLYISEQTHSSIEKAAITLGLGLDSITKIPVDHNYRMIADRLKQAIHDDKAKGVKPFCVVATVGTTSTTSIDPVPEIADICEAEDLWLHVDAAYGGSAAVVPEMQHILDGCDRADSLVLNPHKWLFVPIDFSAFYTKKPDLLKQAFSLIPEYLRTDRDSDVTNLMDYGIQLGRRFRALKFWFVLRYFGRQGIIDRIRYHLQLARTFSGWVEASDQFEVMAPAPFSTVCFRAHPAEIDTEEALNALNEQLLSAVNATRQVFLSHTKLNGAYVLRVAIGNLRTEERHLEQVWTILQDSLASLEK
jgi:aromatic-L-amino-acid decarboxylase